MSQSYIVLLTLSIFSFFFRSKKILCSIFIWFTSISQCVDNRMLFKWKNNKFHILFISTIKMNVCKGKHLCQCLSFSFRRCELENNPMEIRIQYSVCLSMLHYFQLITTMLFYTYEITNNSRYMYKAQNFIFSYLFLISISKEKKKTYFRFLLENSTNTKIKLIIYKLLDVWVLEGCLDMYVLYLKGSPINLLHIIFRFWSLPVFIFHLCFSFFLLSFIVKMISILFSFTVQLFTTKMETKWNKYDCREAIYDRKAIHIHFLKLPIFFYHIIYITYHIFVWASVSLFLKLKHSLHGRLNGIQKMHRNANNISTFYNIPNRMKNCNGQYQKQDFWKRIEW